MLDRLEHVVAVAQRHRRLLLAQLPARQRHVLGQRRLVLLRLELELELVRVLIVLGEVAVEGAEYGVGTACSCATPRSGPRTTTTSAAAGPLLSALERGVSPPRSSTRSMPAPAG